MEREVRYLPLGASGIEVRKAENGAVGIRGTASVTRSVSEDLGGFTEEIEPGAYEKALERSDVRGLFNHDPNYVLGRSNRTMRVSADVDGMHYDIPQLPKARADVLEAIERGDVDGNSFSFTVGEGGDKWTTRNGKPHRVITAFEEIFDVGPVTFPAYADTVVSARSRDMARRMANDAHQTVNFIVSAVDSKDATRFLQEHKDTISQIVADADRACARRMAKDAQPTDPPENEVPEPQPDPATKEDIEGLRRRIELLEATQEG